MLQNADFLVKIGADTAENEQHLPKFGQKMATTLRVRVHVRAHPARVARSSARGRLRRVALSQPCIQYTGCQHPYIIHIRIHLCFCNFRRFFHTSDFSVNRRPHSILHLSNIVFMLQRLAQRSIENYAYTVGSIAQRGSSEYEN